jgi:cob(I)alamin adenosyltransferase
MTLYTGSGDLGKTGLFSGERVSKADPRIQASGSVDELNSTLGALIAGLPETQTDLIIELRRIQSDLFSIGAWVSTTPDSPAQVHLKSIDDERVIDFQKGIDDMQAVTPRLNRFILPGGHPTSAWAHIARAVCRRCECHAAQIWVNENPNSLSENCKTVMRYLNRLSDYLFALARYCNHIHDQKDIEWKG